MKITEAAKRGEANRRDLAFLTDRILMLENKKQIYSTQFRGNKNGSYSLYPVQNRKNLDSIRKKVDLEPFALYQEKMKKFYKIVDRKNAV